MSTAYAEQQKQTMATKSTIVNISTNKFKKIKIPIPSLEIQEKIVQKLEYLRELCEGEIGIKAEIEVTEKQYKCFRDLLIPQTKN
nr:restriction endonuclease subunit S [Candidatus Mycoplasma haemohominis]